MAKQLEMSNYNVLLNITGLLPQIRNSANIIKMFLSVWVSSELLWREGLCKVVSSG